MSYNQISPFHRRHVVSWEKPAWEMACPFCHRPFKGLGNHLQHWAERGDTDYRGFLSAKTGQKTVRQLKQPCQQCGRHFKHLETQLRNNAACKDISPTTVRATDVSATSPLPLLVNYLHMTHVLLDSPYYMHCALLPHTEDQWNEVNEFIAVHILPPSLSLDSIDRINNIIFEVFYIHLASVFGTKPTSKKGKR